MPFKNLTAATILDLAVLSTDVSNPPPVEDDPHFGPRVVPLELSRFLARLRLLEGVPFAYLAPDADLLPRESIRFFYLDRAWTDALVQGALSVGTVNSADRAELQALYPVIRDEVDEEERRVRLPGGESVQQGPAGPITGFLIRSRAISGWPGVHVRAYREELGVSDDATIPESDPRRVKLLRMERLAPAVLLVLFDGIPAVVHIEEPRQGIQFGVFLTQTTAANTFTGAVTARDALTTANVNPQVDVPAPFRRGAPGVLDLVPTERVAHEHDRHEHGNRGRQRRVRPADAAVSVSAGVRRSERRRHDAGSRDRLQTDDRALALEAHIRGGLAAVSDRFDAETIAKATASPRWSALVRTGVDAATIGTWDPGLVRDTRVLVPIDVQALYVPAGSTEPMCRIALALAAADGDPPAAATPVLEDGPPREAGVHLHWLPPDALLRGSFDADRSTNRLGLATLPDRWVVVRVLVPKGQLRAHVRGWVIEADTAKAVSIDEYPAGAAAAPQAGRTVPPADLNGSAGGSLNWVAVYDATINRLAFFDPLDDLATVAPSGVEGDHVSYVVAGWWSSPSADPLDGAHTTANLHSRLHDLGWALTDDHEGGDQPARRRDGSPPQAGITGAGERDTLHGGRATDRDVRARHRRATRPRRVAD